MASVLTWPGSSWRSARWIERKSSSGRTGAARAAIQRALELAPRNANGRTISGFVLAAQYRLKEAIAEFDEAIRLDPALGNARLGRGLCKRRLGWVAQSKIG